MAGFTHISTVRCVIRSYDDLCECFSGAEFEVVPLDRRPVAGAFDVFALGSLVLTSGVFYATQRTRGVIGANAYTVGVPLDLGAPGRVTQWGQLATPGDIFLMPPATDQDGHVIGGSRYVTLTIDKPSFAALGLGELGIASMEFGGPTHVRSTPDAAATLLGGLSRLVRVLTQTSDALTPAQASHLQDEMLSPLLRALVDPRGAASSPTSVLPRPAIRRLEEWIDGHDSAVLTARELALNMGMPLRTLQRAFATNIGLGPRHYLTLRRLARVRRDLIAAEPGATTVSATAAAHGFFEFGRFSGLYRRWYGELPSTTLARPKGAYRTRTLNG